MNQLWWEEIKIPFKFESHSGANGSHHLVLHMILLTPQFTLIPQQRLVPAAWKGKICWCTRCKLAPSPWEPSSAGMRTLPGLWRLASWSSPPDLMGHKALVLGYQLQRTVTIYFCTSLCSGSCINHRALSLLLSCYRTLLNMCWNTTIQPLSHSTVS